MKKPTDKELLAIEQTVPPYAQGRRCGRLAAQRRALHDAGIAHGWRECIEALRESSRAGSESAEWCADYLEHLAKERGHG